MISLPVIGIISGGFSGETPEPPEFEGVLKIIGRYHSSGADFGVEPAIKACAPVYDFVSGEIEHVYQRPRIYDTVGEAEMQNFGICAIDGSFAISCQLEAFSNDGRYVIVTPYNIDSGMETPEIWEGETLDAGADVDLIDAGEDYSPRDIVMVNPGRFIISKYRDTEGTTWNIEIVSYTSPTSNSIVNCNIDMVTLGYTDITISSGSQSRFAINIDTRECAIALKCYGLVEEETVFYILLVNFNVDNGAINSHSLALEDGEWTPLAGLSEITERCLSLADSSFYYKFGVGSFDNILVTYDTNSYGEKIQYKTYTARTAIDGNISYTDLSAITTIQVPPLWAPALVGTAFAVIDGEFYPRFGGIGLFIK